VGNERGHGHDHGHSPGIHSKAFAVGIALNLGFVVVEVAYGILAHSMALGRFREWQWSSCPAGVT
jgi:cobalt-zinc-cadmium efflux system protein